MVDFAKALQKSRSQFDKILALDCETSGLNFDGDPSEGYRMLSIGCIVATSDFEPIEELYVEFKWGDSDKEYKWSQHAQNVHGMSKEYLDEHGISDVEGAEKLGGLLYEHYGLETPITLCGTNVGTFDYNFLRKFLISQGLTAFKFSHRFLDTFSLGYGTVKAYTSDELFDILGFKKRDKHNALEDARMSLKAFKLLSSLWQSQIG